LKVKVARWQGDLKQNLTGRTGLRALVYRKNGLKVNLAALIAIRRGGGGVRR
jgi:hypothetical protein